MTPRLVLVGPPGAGKTTVGRRLANRWQVSFLDTDTEIEKAVGKSVADIFLEDGEPFFRQREVDTVVSLVASFDGVLSLGGGAVLDERVRAALSGLPVVWIDVELPLAVRRVGLNTARPLLVGSVRSKLATLLKERAPFYREVAKWRVLSSEGSPDRTVDKVVAAVEGADDGSVRN